MTRSKLIDEADAVRWIETTKGGGRAVAIIDALLAELQRLWAMEDELERIRRQHDLRTDMREDRYTLSRIIHGGRDHE